MARKINVKLILELREAKLSRNQIADSRHIARNSVSDVFRIADERGITYSDIRSLTEAEAYEKIEAARWIFAEEERNKKYYWEEFDK